MPGTDSHSTLILQPTENVIPKENISHPKTDKDWMQYLIKIHNADAFEDKELMSLMQLKPEPFTTEIVNGVQEITSNKLITGDDSFDQKSEDNIKDMTEEDFEFCKEQIAKSQQTENIAKDQSSPYTEWALYLTAQTCKATTGIDPTSMFQSVMRSPDNTTNKVKAAAAYANMFPERVSNFSKQMQNTPLEKVINKFISTIGESYLTKILQEITGVPVKPALFNAAFILMFMTKRIGAQETMDSDPLEDSELLGDSDLSDELIVHSGKSIFGNLCSADDDDYQEKCHNFYITPENGNPDQIAAATNEMEYDYTDGALDNGGYNDGYGGNSYYKCEYFDECMKDSDVENMLLKSLQSKIDDNENAFSNPEDAENYRTTSSNFGGCRAISHGQGMKDGVWDSFSLKFLNKANECQDVGEAAKSGWIIFGYTLAGIAGLALLVGLGYCTLRYGPSCCSAMGRGISNCFSGMWEGMKNCGEKLTSCCRAKESVLPTQSPKPNPRMTIVQL